MIRNTIGRLLSPFFALVLAGLPMLGTGAHPALAGTEHGIVNGLLRAQIRQLERSHRGLHAQQVLMVPLVLTSTRDAAAAVRRMGGKLEADIGGRVLAARMPAGAVSSLAAQPGVRELFPATRYHLSLDRSVPEIRANLAWTETDRSGLPEKGKGVLIGTVDSGIDYNNPDFINPDGTTRVLSIWDQTQNGNPPAGYDFGTLCDRASIQSGSCEERDTDGHGTHVAGIAAGNGRSGGTPPEIGVAPQADLLVVKSDLTLDHVLAAWKYLTDTARALGRPIVVNNSFGSSISPHDGSSPDSQAIDQLAGPGRIFVAAAGNEGGSGPHTSGLLSPSSTASLSFSGTGDSDELSVGVFYPTNARLNFTLTNRNSGEQFQVNDGGSIEDRKSRDGSQEVTMESGSWNSRWSVLYADVKSNSGTIQSDYRLEMAPVSVVGTPQYDAWVEPDGSATLANPVDNDTVGNPADGRSIIAVGNYATRTQWTDQNGASLSVCNFFPCNGGKLDLGDIAASSSIGPTRDGRQKPDISAPGTMIISSLSRDATFCGPASSGDCRSTKELSQDGLHLVDTGTSMSSPHVAGTVALMLQADPALDPAGVLAILRSTARHDQFTGAGWSPTFGAGKVDADAAVRAALDLPAATATPIPAAATATPAPTATPQPTSTPIPLPTLNIVAVRVDKHGTSSGWQLPSGLTQVKVRSGIDLSVYSQINHLWSPALVHIDWRIIRNGTTAFARSRQFTRGVLDDAVVWNHVRFSPQRAGSFTFAARVSMGSLVSARSISFRVTKK